MLTEENKETLKDGVHTVVSAEGLTQWTSPIGVGWIKARLTNRAGVAMNIVTDEDADAVIEETMNNIVTLASAFPNVAVAAPGIDGPRWVIS